jgi:hypothetical protein
MYGFNGRGFDQSVGSQKLCVLIRPLKDHCHVSSAVKLGHAPGLSFTFGVE